ncbi:MAG: hypothetical protein ABJM08_05585 [Nonlabens sp.]|uniref:hypothetical protein n=1 Tax=Nonlabens sp. TaxID=1888209 RepID=UPI0032982B4F
MNKYIVYIILISLFLVSCSKKDTLNSEWSIKVQEGSRLSLIKNELYLIEATNGSCKINSTDGNKIKWVNVIYKIDNNNLSKTNNSEDDVNYRLDEEGIYSLTGKFDYIDNCQLSLHTYILSKKEEDGSTSYFHLDGKNRFYVADYQVLDKDLYMIISNGDIHQLKKFLLL